MPNVPSWAEGLKAADFEHAPAQKLQAPQGEYAELFASLTSPHSALSSELNLLEPLAWMTGLWSIEKDTDGIEIGWRDSRTDMVLSFDDVRNLIEARISELGLSAELVHAFPHTRRFFANYAEEHRFWNLPFEQRMARFKA